MSYFILLPFSYLFGSIPWAYICCKLIKGIDIREFGSKNPGATNAIRVCGIKIGMLALILDIAKGYLPIKLGENWGMSPLGLIILGSVAIIGHLFPVFLKFKGGKAVAVALGVFLGLTPLALLSSFLLLIIVAVISGYVSVGSILFAITLPYFTLLYKEPISTCVFASIVGIIIIIKHIPNIRRLIAREEKKFYTLSKT